MVCVSLPKDTPQTSLDCQYRCLFFVLFGIDFAQFLFQIITGWRSYQRTDFFSLNFEFSWSSCGSFPCTITLFVFPVCVQLLSSGCQCVLRNISKRPDSHWHYWFQVLSSVYSVFFLYVLLICVLSFMIIKLTFFFFFSLFWDLDFVLAWA